MESKQIKEQLIIEDLLNASVELTGLAEILYAQMNESIGGGDFRGAQKLSWAYDCLATCAAKLARELSDVSI